MELSKENNIEFLTGADTATITFTQRKYISKIKRLAKKYPDEIKYYVENKDGSVCAEVPLTWIKVSHPKIVSDEQREAARQRLANGKKSKKAKELLNETI